MKKKLVNVKKFLAISFAIIVGVCSFACQGECSHRDADDSGKCDMCGVEFTDAKDKCDVCGGVLTNGECQACNETNVEDEKCSTCGGALVNGKCEACDKEEENEIVSLDGKKILFTSNSLTYYGQTVLGSAGAANLVTKKQNDKGYFYQFCKENGATVNVANWTFSGHVFSEVFGGVCASCTSSQGKTINHLD